MSLFYTTIDSVCCCCFRYSNVKAVMLMMMVGDDDDDDGDDAVDVDNVRGRTETLSRRLYAHRR